MLACQDLLHQLQKCTGLAVGLLSLTCQSITKELLRFIDTKLFRNKEKVVTQ